MGSPSSQGEPAIAVRARLHPSQDRNNPEDGRIGATLPCTGGQHQEPGSQMTRGPSRRAYMQLTVERLIEPAPIRDDVGESLSALRVRPLGAPMEKKAGER